ncbi:hypothetical protein DUNSADRAFT_11778, partial [Dunaliella salina]
AGSEFVTDDTDTCPYPHAFGDSTCPTGPSFVVRLESHFAARTIIVETLQATDGRDFDTVLLVSPSCSSVDIIASDDDGGSGLLSKLTLQVDAYQDVFIAVNGYFDGCGLMRAKLVVLPSPPLPSPFPLPLPPPSPLSP